MLLSNIFSVLERSSIFDFLILENFFFFFVLKKTFILALWEKVEKMNGPLAVSLLNFYLIYVENTAFWNNLFDPHL